MMVAVFCGGALFGVLAVFAAAAIYVGARAGRGEDDAWRRIDEVVQADGDDDD